MTLWKIEPVARVDDPRWLNHQIWSEVIVRAPTPGEAIATAGRMAEAELGGETPMGNESLTFASGFQDEKLYAVHRVDPGNEPGLEEEGPAEVLRAEKGGGAGK